MLKLSEEESVRLQNFIEACYRTAQADHQDRLQRFRNYYRKFRGLRDPAEANDPTAPRFTVPAIKWTVYSTWARVTMSLIGEDAKIKVVPRGPTDVRLVRKIETYMKWRVFEYMRAAEALSTLMFQAVLYGRSHAYLPWTTRKRAGEIVYDGPELVPLWPEEIVLPPGDYRTLHEAPWVIRKYWISPQDLIDGEREGRYEGISENWDRIVHASKQIRDRSEDPVLWAKDEAESVNISSLSEDERLIEAWEWYGYWRPREKDGNFSKERYEVMVRFLPTLRLMIGIYDLETLFPRMSFRRPFVSFSLSSDGSYWSPGVGELVTEISDEMTESDRMISRALQFSTGPVVLFRPTGGFDPEAFEYQPGVAYPVDDPSSVREISFRADIEQAIVRQQMLATYLERVTGINDQTLGRSIERPNAPRTLGGQQLLLQQSSVRFLIDEFFIRQSMRQFLRQVWELDSQFCDSSVFFRVTEEDAEGLLGARGGFAEMTPLERMYFVDFEFDLASEQNEKELRKAEALQLYQLDLGNPLIVQNPKALWKITNRLHEAFGDDEFKRYVPEPPDIGNPLQPKDEWVMILQGEPVQVHPMDDDLRHIQEHMAQIENEKLAASPDMAAMKAMARHIAEHQSQLMQKRMMVGLAKDLARSMEQSTQNPALGGIVAQPPVPVPLQGLMGAIQDLAGGGAAPAPSGGPEKKAPKSSNK